MKNADINNMLAMLADAEARHTAGMVELVAAVVLSKTHSWPIVSDGEIVSLTITPADIANVAREFHFECRYGDDSMTIHLTQI